MNDWKRRMESESERAREREEEQDKRRNEGREEMKRKCGRVKSELLR